MKRYFIALCLAAILFCYPCASAQEPSVSPPNPEQSIPKAPVMLGNETLFTILTRIKGVPLKDRAEVISERIQRIAEDESIPVESFATRDYTEPLTVITAQEIFLMSVLEDDARAAGRSRQEFAAELSLKIRTAIEQYRREHRFAWLLKGILLTIITTLVFTGIIYLIARLYRKTETLLTAWVKEKKLSLGIQSIKLLQTEQLQQLIAGAIRILRFFSFLILVLLYIQIVLRFFPWTRSHSRMIDDYLLTQLGIVATAIVAQIPKLVFLAIIFTITFYVLKLLKLIFRGIEFKTIRLRSFQPEWAQPTYRLCRIGVVAFALVVAFPYIPGSDSLAFKGVSIFLGVLFSLGSTSAIANLIAGYTIIYRNLFKEGDRIRIDGISGTVVRTGLQVIYLRTVKNEEISVPSSTIVNSHVINYSALARERGLILHTAVTIGYDAPWRQVHALLLMAAEKTTGLLCEPKPFVLQKSLDDFYVTYELNAYTDAPATMERIYSELHQNIQDAFNEYGVQIMSPNYEADRDRPTVVPRDQWYPPPASKPADEQIK